MLALFQMQQQRSLIEKKNIAVKNIYGIFSIASFMCNIADGFTYKGGFS